MRKNAQKDQINWHILLNTWCFISLTIECHKKQKSITDHYSIKLGIIRSSKTCQDRYKSKTEM